MKKKHISICICSFKRPQFLRRTLENLRVLETEGLFDYSIVVVDNDREQTAQETVLDFAKTALVKISYGVEPEQNISLARNKALELATGDFVAWIDDDEFPEERWLLNFYKTLDQTNSDGALGPVEPVFERTPPSWILKGKFFEKRRDRITGSKLKWNQTTTANALVRRDLFKGLTEPFRRQFSSGCEDVDFFKRMMEYGHSFLWCNEAVVHEVIPPARCKRLYLIRRALMRGQNNRHFADAESVVRSIIALPLYFLLLPFLLLMGQHFFMQYLMKIGDHAGNLLGVAGVIFTGKKYLNENLKNA
ncbi:MAG TPA: glycosyltransferase family 2 protein [Verrucomicrobiae bacterium]|jgi:glycosyltransferase involved in cell wall biosynthesis